MYGITSVMNSIAATYLYIQRYSGIPVLTTTPSCTVNYAAGYRITIVREGLELSMHAHSGHGTAATGMFSPCRHNGMNRSGCLWVVTGILF